jgi:ubiquinone/menaquinone biosynthesis C-methylase UbiE
MSEPDLGSSANHSAFDEIASSYDSVFVRTSVMRAQRRTVWTVAKNNFRPGARILELNCGTGEDALFLARLGLSVVACDASKGMIEVAQRRKKLECNDLPITFLAVPTERILSVAQAASFDGVFSNFSGLNFVRDLDQVVEDLAALTRPRAQLLLCVASRICLWETLWFSAHLQLRQAVRRFSGFTVGRVGSSPIDVWYRSIHHFRRRFSPFFRLHNICAVGLCVPPYYVEPWAQRHQRSLRVAETCDRILQRIPLLRVLGDHVLLHFEKRAQ